MRFCVEAETKNTKEHWFRSCGMTLMSLPAYKGTIVSSDGRN